MASVRFAIGVVACGSSSSRTTESTTAVRAAATSAMATESARWRPLGRLRRAVEGVGAAGRSVAGVLELLEVLGSGAMVNDDGTAAPSVTAIRGAVDLPESTEARRERMERRQAGVRLGRHPGSPLPVAGTGGRPPNGEASGRCRRSSGRE